MRNSYNLDHKRESIVPMDPYLYSQNYRSAIRILEEQEENSYLRIDFEDLLLNYRDTVKKTERF